VKHGLDQARRLNVHRGVAAIIAAQTGSELADGYQFYLF
jgi:hypothetical protein